MNDHIVSDWYETQTLSDGIFLIREKYVAHWLRCNIWLVKGRDRNLVIDSGMGLSPLKPGLLALAGSSLTAVIPHGPCPTATPMIRWFGPFHINLRKSDIRPSNAGIVSFTIATCEE